MSEEDGVTLHFYKDNNGTPVLNIIWVEGAKNILAGNGFSALQMKIILRSQLASAKVPRYIKVIVLELIEQLAYAAIGSEDVLEDARSRKTISQQRYRLMKQLKQRKEGGE